MLKTGSQSSGVYGLYWAGRDKFGKKVSPGVYFCQLQSGNETKVKKMLFGLGGTDIKAATEVTLPITRMKGDSIYEATILYSCHFYS